MGYTTYFEGNLNINEKMNKDHINYFNSLMNTRRMKRDTNIIKAIYPNWAFMCLDGNLGVDGEFFCNPIAFGQIHDESIIDYNRPPITQPGLWCGWILKENNDGSVILEWNGGEKFYNYVEWLEYLIKNFFLNYDYHPYGVFLYAGEESEDAGYIIVENDKVKCFNYQEEKLKILKNITDKKVIDMLEETYRTPDDVENSYWNRGYY